MDDMFLWHNEKAFLKDAKHGIQQFVKERLKCTLKTALINNVERGIPFCGFLLRPDSVRLTQRSKQRYIRKMNHIQARFESGEWRESECQQRANAVLAFINHADVKAFKKDIFEQNNWAFTTGY